MDNDARFEAACNAFNLLPEANKALFFKLANSKVYEYVEANKINTEGLQVVLMLGLFDDCELWIMCDFHHKGEVFEEKVPLVRLLAFQSTPFVHPVTERVQ